MVKYSWHSSSKSVAEAMRPTHKQNHGSSRFGTGSGKPAGTWSGGDSRTDRSAYLRARRKHTEDILRVLGANNDPNGLEAKEQ